MDTIQIITLTMGTAWASGINLYATIFMLGLMGAAEDLLVIGGIWISAGLVDFCLFNNLVITQTMARYKTTHRQYPALISR